MRTQVFALCLVLYTTSAFAQITFKTAGEESGIIVPKSGGFNAGYEFSDDEAVFAYSLMKESTIMEGGTTFTKFRSTTFKVNIPIENKTKDLFSDNRFNPGLDLTFEHAWNNNTFEEKKPYNFFKAGYASKVNAFGMVDAMDSIIVEEKTSHIFTGIYGWNWLISGCRKKDKQNILIALSLPFKYFIHPVAGLNTKEFIIDQKTAKNGVVQKSQEAYDSTVSNYLTAMFKVDFAWTPVIPLGADGVEKSVRFGFIASVSTQYHSALSAIVNNFSVGPSIHPKWSTSSVITTIQAEFLDFTDATGKKSARDIFGVRFYVGIPIRK